MKRLTIAASIVTCVFANLGLTMAQEVLEYATQTVIDRHPSLQEGGYRVAHSYQALKAAKTKEEKQDAVVALKDALGLKFDHLMQREAEELEQMEQRLRQLRAKLEHRRDAKEEMVDLQLKKMIYEADGLGWPEDSRLDREFRPDFPFPAAGLEPTEPVRSLVPRGER